MVFFPNAQGQVTPVPGQILWNLEPIRDFMGFLVACEYEEDPIKNEGTRVVTTLFIDFSDAQGQLTSKSVMESWQNSIFFDLILYVPSTIFQLYRDVPSWVEPVLS